LRSEPITANAPHGSRYVQRATGVSIACSLKRIPRALQPAADAMCCTALSSQSLFARPGQLDRRHFQRVGQPFILRALHDYQIRMQMRRQINGGA
jgi:hypothetical protein